MQKQLKAAWDGLYEKLWNHTGIAEGLIDSL